MIIDHIIASCTFIESSIYFLFQPIALDFINYYKLQDIWISYFMIANDIGILLSCIFFYFVPSFYTYKRIVQCFLLIQIIVSVTSIFDISEWILLLLRFLSGMYTLTIILPLFIYEQHEENPDNQHQGILINSVYDSLGTLVGLFLPGILGFALHQSNTSYPFMNWVISNIILSTIGVIVLSVISFYAKRNQKALTITEIQKSTERRNEMIQGSSKRHLQQTKIDYFSILDLFLNYISMNVNDSFIGSVFLLELSNGYSMSTNDLSIIYGVMTFLIIIFVYLLYSLLLKVNQVHKRWVQYGLPLLMIACYMIILFVVNMYIRITFVTIILTLNTLLSIWTDNQLFSTVSKSVECKVNAIKIFIMNVSTMLGAYVGTIIYEESSFEVSLALPICTIIFSIGLQMNINTFQIKG